MNLSGEQIEIECDHHQRATIAAVGATLRSYTVGSRAVIDGFDAASVCPDGRGQILAPWPNRIADGRYDFAGKTLQLPINERTLGHAIHGLVRWAEWQVAHRSGAVVRLTHRLSAMPGYPFEIDLTVEYRLSPSGLAVTFEATNTGPAACPFGIGAHPYLSFPGIAVDHVEISIPALEWLPTDERAIPVALQPIATSPIDWRAPRVIGSTRLDQAFTHLKRDDAGRAWIVLRHGPDQIRVWLDEAFEFLQVYTGDAVTEPARRRLSVAVEPMSCAPNAFNNAIGLRVLAPGESFSGRWGLSA